MPDKIPVAQCSTCGIVTGDELTLFGTHMITCGKCGARLEKVKFITEEEFERRKQSA